MRIRIFQETDAKEMFALYDSVYAADRVSWPFFVRYFLLSPNFDPAGTFLAEENGRIAGWASGQVIRKDFDVWGDQARKNAGTGFLMPPVTRDAETGKELISAVEEYFRSGKCVRSKGAAAGYTLFPNGVDRAAYPAVHRAFEESGYTCSAFSYSMHRSLENYSVPEAIREKTDRLAAEGILADICRCDDLPGLRHLLAETDLNGWMHLPLRKAEQGRLDEALVVRRGSEILGYCQYNYFGEAERIGPFGISGDMRGKGLGTVMVAKLLEIMAGRGFRYAWFASCTEQKIPFYAKNGLQVFRKKSIFVKERI